MSCADVQQGSVVATARMAHGSLRLVPVMLALAVVLPDALAVAQRGRAPGARQASAPLDSEPDDELDGIGEDLEEDFGDSISDDDSIGDDDSVGDGDSIGDEDSPDDGGEGSSSAEISDFEGEVHQGEDDDGEAAGSGGPLRLRLTVGAGVGFFGYRMPRSAQREVLPDAPYAGFEGQLAVVGRLSETFWLSGQLRYRTSVGLQLEQMPQFGLPEEHPARVQGIELSVAPEFIFDWLQLSVPVGFATTVFSVPDDQFPAQGFAYGGPFLRPELGIELADGLWAHVGPELQFLVLYGGAMKDQGYVPGLAWGYVAMLSVAATEALVLSVGYQERRAMAESRFGPFEGVERLLSARVAGHF